nr:hypothetical transcript [Hymenolepis microstoma]
MPCEFAFVLLIVHLFPAKSGFYRLTLFINNPFNQEVNSNFDRTSRLTPLFKDEFTFTQNDVSNVQIPSVLSNIWGILNGKRDDLCEDSIFSNKTGCCVINPLEGLIIIEAANFPRLLPFVIWRKNETIEIITRTRKASTVSAKPNELDLNEDDPFVDDEDETDCLVNPTLKFCEPGSYIVEIYGIAKGVHPVTGKHSQIIELIGQFLVYIHSKKTKLGKEGTQSTCIGHIEVRN